MKQLNCLECEGIVRLLIETERACQCGRSSGRYTSGGARATYRGPDWTSLARAEHVPVAADALATSCRCRSQAVVWGVRSVAAGHER